MTDYTIKHVVIDCFRVLDCHERLITMFNTRQEAEQYVSEQRGSDLDDRMGEALIESQGD